MNLHSKTASAPSQTLDDRIRSVRRSIRARQPLQTRIDLVRERHAARTASSGARSAQGAGTGQPITASEAQAPSRRA